MDSLIVYGRLAARVLSWIGIAAIVILTVVPAIDRPETVFGPRLEHLAAFALVAGAFAAGYRFSLARLLLLALVFCGGIELLQIPLPTRHARLRDFVLDLIASCIAIGLVFVAEKLVGIDRKTI